jgi:hypothetical protein
MILSACDPFATPSANGAICAFLPLHRDSTDWTAGVEPKHKIAANGSTSRIDALRTEQAAAMSASIGRESGPYALISAPVETPGSATFGVIVESVLNRILSVEKRHR